MWENEWEQLNEKDREQFGRVINILMQKTFIVRDEVDTRTKNIVINKDFRFLERHRTLFERYLNVIGWDIQLDNHRGVAGFYNRYEYNRKRIDKNTTYFLYALRLIYEKQMEKLSVRKEVMTSVGEVVEKMHHLGLLDRKPSDKALRDSLSALRGFNIIERLDGGWTSPDTRLVIYPSIIFLVTNEKICDLYEQLGLGEMPGGEEDEDEETGEDAVD
ncbi:MAG: DUF4194 domain-containing protein [Dethiobacter sp.]|jgi:hypothetical protein|nr:DUF4194 domain-containing protein [Dethiobacter sp.]